jgi:hypothetical protein
MRSQWVGHFLVIAVVTGLAVAAGAAPRRNSYCQKAQQMYGAASADARTLERAMFVTEMRRQLETVLGRQLSDPELRELSDHARAEAHYWYKYMQGLVPACAPAPPSNPAAVR